MSVHDKAKAWLALLILILGPSWGHGQTHRFLSIPEALQAVTSRSRLLAAEKVQGGLIVYMSARPGMDNRKGSLRDQPYYIYRIAYDHKFNLTSYNSVALQHPVPEKTPGQDKGMDYCDVVQKYPLLKTVHRLDPHNKYIPLKQFESSIIQKDDTLGILRIRSAIADPVPVYEQDSLVIPCIPLANASRIKQEQFFPLLVAGDFREELVPHLFGCPHSGNTIGILENNGMNQDNMGKGYFKICLTDTLSIEYEAVVNACTEIHSVMPFYNWYHQQRHLEYMLATYNSPDKRQWQLSCMDRKGKKVYDRTFIVGASLDSIALLSLFPGYNVVLAGMSGREYHFIKAYKEDSLQFTLDPGQRSGLVDHNFDFIDYIHHDSIEYLVFKAGASSVARDVMVVFPFRDQISMPPLYITVPGQGRAPFSNAAFVVNDDKDHLVLCIYTMKGETKFLPHFYHINAERGITPFANKSTMASGSTVVLSKSASRYIDADGLYLSLIQGFESPKEAFLVKNYLSLLIPDN